MLKKENMQLIRRCHILKWLLAHRTSTNYTHAWVKSLRPRRTVKVRNKTRCVLEWEVTATSLPPDRLWGPPSLLSDGYQGLFARELSGRGVKLTTHLRLVPRLRVNGTIPSLLHMSSCHSASLSAAHFFMAW
jgi:hypothetical protein